MTYDNFTDAQLRGKLSYHDDRITDMLAEIMTFEVELAEVQRSIDVRNEFIHEHDKRKALVRNEMRGRARLADAVEYCDCGDTMAHDGKYDVADDEPRITGVQPPPWDETDETQDSIAPPSHPWLDTLEERVE